MCLQKIFPRSIRMAFLYAKSKKIAANKSLDREKKIEAIHKKEKSWIGTPIDILKGVGEQDAAIAIGFKDMAKIFTSLDAPNDALRYLDVLEKSFPAIVEFKKQNEAIYEAYVFSMLYRGIAYAQKGQIDKCQKQFDLLNKTLNESISADPSNSRIQDVYGYCNKHIFDTYMSIANNYSDLKQQAYRACLNQFKEFDSRDPDNEQIQDFISRFTVS